jgi:hypothetical protein
MSGGAGAAQPTVVEDRGEECSIAVGQDKNAAPRLVGAKPREPLEVPWRETCPKELTGPGYAA